MKVTMRSKLTFGKYKDKTFLYVSKKNASYLYWMINKTEYDIPANIYEYISDKRGYSNSPQGGIGIVNEKYDYLCHEDYEGLPYAEMYEGDGSW